MKEEILSILRLLNAAQSNYVEAIRNDAPVPVRNLIWQTIRQLAEKMRNIYNNDTPMEQDETGPTRNY